MWWKRKGRAALLLVPHNFYDLVRWNHGKGVMAVTHHSAALKLVGGNGHISLGKRYAGRHVLVEAVTVRKDDVSAAD